jgi:repressor LexA
MEQLTERQRHVFDFIKEFISNSGSSPTIRDIAKNFGISIGPAQKYIRVLIKKGYLKQKTGISRGLDVVFRKPLVSVPLVGKVAAGTPIEAIENIESYVYVEKNIVRSGRYFALKVKGDSMTGSGIFENDVIVVKQQGSAENGETVVSMIENEAVVKKLRITPEAVYLESTNPKYKPILLRQGSGGQVWEAKIMGKVVYLMRSY